MEGGSAWTGVNPYSPTAQADQVVEMMDKLGLDKAILIGNSAGGTIAMLTALEHPDRVPGARAGGCSDLQRRRRAGLGSPAARPRRSSSVSAHWPVASWRRPESGLLASGVARSVEGHARRARGLSQGHSRQRTGTRGLWELTKASENLNLEARLAEVTQPTLVITGDDDRIVPTADSDPAGGRAAECRTGRASPSAGTRRRKNVLSRGWMRSRGLLGDSRALASAQIGG